MIGIFGGTFNPIHHGHLRSALEMVELLGLYKLHIVPCGIPPHRETPQVGAQQRLAMLQAAVAGEPVFVVDDREIKRGGPSYSLDTVKSVREEYAANDPRQAIVLIIGADAFRGFDTWHEWRSIMDYVHIVVMQRPDLANKSGAHLSPQLQSFADERQVESVKPLWETSHGKLYFHTVTQLDISSSQIRERIAEGKSARYLMPDAVWRMIRENQYYC